MAVEKVILFEEKTECCGCSACKTICPRQAISFEKDEEGFNFPVIDEEKCIACRMCIKVCPLK